VAPDLAPVGGRTLRIKPARAGWRCFTRHGRHRPAGPARPRGADPLGGRHSPRSAMTGAGATLSPPPATTAGLPRRACVCTARRCATAGAHDTRLHPGGSHGCRSGAGGPCGAVLPGSAHGAHVERQAHRGVRVASGTRVRPCARPAVLASVGTRVGRYSRQSVLASGGTRIGRCSRRAARTAAARVMSQP